MHAYNEMKCEKEYLTATVYEQDRRNELFIIFQKAKKKKKKK